MTPVRDFCQLWLCQFPYVPVKAPYGTLAGHARAPYGSRGIWKTLEIPVQGPYDARAGTVSARTGIARGTRGVLRIIQPTHKYTDVSSRTGPVAWCDLGNSTDVKFLRALHSALQARNRSGDKNRTGPVVGCDWGINHHNDVIMDPMVSQIISLTIVSAAVYLRRRSKKTSKLIVTGLCVGNSPVTGEFPAQRASNAEKVSIWWRHHVQVDLVIKRP